MIGTFGKLQNLIPNEMQNKLAESFDKKLDELQQITNQADDFLNPHNNMEGQNDLDSDGKAADGCIGKSLFYIVEFPFCLSLTSRAVRE